VNQLDLHLESKDVMRDQLARSLIKKLMRHSSYPVEFDRRACQWKIHGRSVCYGNRKFYTEINAWIMLLFHRASMHLSARYRRSFNNAVVKLAKCKKAACRKMFEKNVR
jgi:hypothetical protein